jgi:hypothetical protein
MQPVPLRFGIFEVRFGGDGVGLGTMRTHFHPPLESAWLQPLNRECDILVSSLCFQMQLVPLQHASVQRRLALPGVQRPERAAEVPRGTDARALSADLLHAADVRVMRGPTRGHNQVPSPRR